MRKPQIIIASLIRDVATNWRASCDCCQISCFSHTHSRNNTRNHFPHPSFVSPRRSGGGGGLLASGLPGVDVRVHGGGGGRVLPALRYRPLPRRQPAARRPADVSGRRGRRPPRRGHVAHAQRALYQLQVQGEPKQRRPRGSFAFHRAAFEYSVSKL